MTPCLPLLMTAVPDAARAGKLLQHLERVYWTAQALTPDAEAARRLVEATYTQALVQVPAVLSDADAHRWLHTLLYQIHREHQAFEASSDPPRPMSMLRERLAELIVDRHLAPIFLELPAAQREVLLLCVVHDLSPADVARVLDVDESEVQAHLETARAACREALFATVAPSERTVVNDALPADWLTPALHRAATTLFDAPPPSLEDSLLKQQTTPPPNPPPEPPRPSPSLLPGLEPETPDADSAIPLPTAAPSQPVPAGSKPAQGSMAPEALRRGGRLLRRTGVAVLLILVVGLIGFLAAQALEQEPETNLILLAASQADDVDLTFPTTNPAQAEDFVQARLGRRLTLPTIDQANLSGAGIHTIVEGVAIPVFRYEDVQNDNEDIAVFVFSYALLDRYQDRVMLAPDVLRQIEDEKRFDLYDLGDDAQVLIWRNRDDIFLAVSSGNAEALRQRILIPS